MSTGKDQEILTLIIRPETRREGYEQLVKAYSRRIYWHVRRMVDDHEDANDVVQNVFLKAWENLGKFRGDSGVYTWLYRIASNEALNFLDARRRKATLSFEDHEEKLEGSLTHSQGLSGEEIQQKLLAAIRKLPDKQRLVFNMKYFDAMPYETISEITGTTVGALKASYHHAVRKIEDYINED